MMMLKTEDTTQQRWQNPNWYHALTLTERATERRHSKDQRSAVSNHEIAAQILQSWKAQRPFNSGTYFCQRLAMDGLTEDDFLTLLAETVDAGQESIQNPPAWVEWLAESFGDQLRVTNDLASQEVEEDGKNVNFFRIIYPFVRRGLMRILIGIQNIAQKYLYLPLDPEAVSSLLIPHILEHMGSKISRTLILELNIARTQERLQGQTSKERFRNFIQQFYQPETLQALLEEYPVLSRLLAEASELWVVRELELLERLCADWEEICALFPSASDSGNLVEIQAGKGDFHRGGRSTTILVWSSGFRLVYKPRPLAIDVHFQELLSWLNELGYQPAFRTFKVLNKGLYGWVEFIEIGPCSSQKEVERFYQRQGGYLALLYALEATDFHAENLLAAGEHPVLVDLEALLHPRTPTQTSPVRKQAGTEAIRHSVLHIGLLPQRLWTNSQSESIDISGMGGQSGQLTPTPVAKWVGIGTDEMRMGWERTEMYMGEHRPKLGDQDVETLRYCESVVLGFTVAYRLLLQNRYAFLEKWLPRFAHDEIRCVLRPTFIYLKFINSSLHPNVLQDALERDRLLDRLWIGVEQSPHLTQLIAAERVDLLAGDVPIFTTHADSCDLFTARGERLANFFAQSGLEMAKKRVSSFHEDDLERQVWIIRASFTSMILGIDEIKQPHLQFHPSSLNVDRDVTSERLLNASRAVGDHLCKIALYDENTAGWLGIQGVKEKEWQLLPADIDLYSGIPGIVLFLAYLGKLTGERRYTALAEKGLSTLRGLSAPESGHTRPINIGAFSGLGSFIYLLSHFGSLWNDPTLYREAEELAKLLPEQIAHDRMFDLIGGSAGCIAVLLSLYSVAPSPETLAVAIQCGEQLVQFASPMQVGVGWLITEQDCPLAGLAHGNAGIALNLLRLFAVTGEERFRQTALQAIEYERSLFSSEEQDWPDLRKAVIEKILEQTGMQAITKEHYSYMVAWCHGASGIGLARLESLPVLDDEMIRAEIEVSLQTTLSKGFGRNHSLCHGDLGNLDLILSATQRLSNPDYKDVLKRLTSALLDTIDSQGWVTGTPQGVETPGLMVGLAGIGYELLRLAFPVQVPSVLVLAPPII